MFSTNVPKGTDLVEEFFAEYLANCYLLFFQLVTLV
jgi:hypothetical protein